MSVVTQYRIDDGSIPDLVIFSGGVPVCAVEVKIDAEIGMGQLEGYGEWLKARAGEGMPAALVLLTHITPVPDEFMRPGDGPYGVTLRGAAYWNEVSEWFAKLGRAGNGVDEPLKTLAGEFGEFLRESDMPTLDDIAIARQYYTNSHEVLSTTVNNMLVGYQFPSYWNAGKGLTHKRAGIWRYYYPADDRSSRFVYFGLSFKPVDAHDDSLYGFRRYDVSKLGVPQARDLEDGYYAFVCIWGPEEVCKYVPAYYENRWYARQDGKWMVSEFASNVDSKGWYYYTTGGGGSAGYAQIQSVQDLLDADGRIGRRLQAWTAGVLGKTVSLWGELFGECK